MLQLYQLFALSHELYLRKLSILYTLSLHMNASRYYRDKLACEMSETGQNNQAPQWTAMSDWPLQDFRDNPYAIGMDCSVWNLNCAEFVLSVNYSDKYKNCRSVGIRENRRILYRYNIHSNTWTPFLLVLKEEMCIDQIEIDRVNRRVFAANWSLTSDEGDLTIFDIRTESVLHRMKFSLRFGRMLCLSGSMHCIAYQDKNNTHKHPTNHIWSEDKQKWKKIVTKAVPDFKRTDSNLIHVSSKNIILSLECDVLWRYHIALKEWDVIKMGGDVAGIKVTATLTRDEEFIIFARSDKYHFQIIDIRDDNAYSLYESSVKIPRNIDFPRMCWAVPRARFGKLVSSGGTKDSVPVISGWIRGIRKTKQFAALMIPEEIETMIVRWYSLEYIHWIVVSIEKVNDQLHLPNHQKIPLDDILEFS